MSFWNALGNIGKGTLGIIPGVDDYFADQDAAKHDRQQTQQLEGNLAAYQNLLPPGVTATNPNQAEIDNIRGSIASTERAAQKLRDMGREREADLMLAGIGKQRERMQRLESAAPSFDYGGIQLDYEVADYAGNVRDMIDQDPAAMNAQSEALAYYQDVLGDGTTEADNAALAMQNRQIANQAAARDDAIVQNMRSRGMGGAGSEIAARIAGQGNATEAAYLQSLGLTQQRQQRRDQAAGSAAGVANTMRDFDARIASLDRAARQQFANEASRVRNQQQLMNRVELPYRAFNSNLQVTDRTADARSALAGVGAQRAGRERQQMYDTADRWRGIVGEATGFALTEDQQKAKAEGGGGGGGGGIMALMGGGMI